MTAPAQHGLPPLFRMALKTGSLPAVLLHIRRGLNVNASDDQGRTPLMIAAQAGRLDICQLLLEEGADAGSRDLAGRDVSQIASSAGQQAVSSLLRRYQNETLPADIPPTVTPVRAQEALPREPAPPAVVDEVGFEDLFGAGWEAEADAGPPPVQDEAVLTAALAVQAAISARTAVNDDTDWREVELALPDIQTVESASSSASVSPAIRRLLLQAAAIGVVTTDEMDLALGASTPAGSGEVICSVLEDLGCEVVGQSDRWPVRSIGNSEPTPGDVALCDEICAALGEGPSAVADPLEAYERDIARWPGMRKDEQMSVWRGLRQARRDLATALSTAPHILDELVARLDQLSARPAAAPTAVAAAEPEEDEENEVRGADASFEALNPVLARDLGLAVQRARQNRNQAGSLADELLELQLPVHLIDQVRRALLLDPASAAACRALGAALQKIERGRTTILKAHQRLVLLWARRYRDRGLPLMDLVQEGNIGLLKAIDRFDAAREVAFTTYATWWVRQAITRAIADLGREVRIPVHRQEGMTKFNRAFAAFCSEHGREPGSDELADRLRMSVETVQALGKLGFEFISIHQQAEVLDPTPPAALRLRLEAPETGVIAAALSAELSRSLSRLDPRQERVLRQRFGMNIGSDMTLEEIGDEFGVTRERIRQIEAKALLRIAHPANNRRLLPFRES